MEDQGKRLLLAVVAALGIVLLWNVLFPSSSSKKPPAPDEVQQPTQLDLESPIEKLPPVEVGAQAQDIDLHYPNVDIEFNSRDARLVSWHLLDPKYKKDPHNGELVADPNIGELQTNFVGSDISIPLGAVWNASQQGDVVTFTYDSPMMSAEKVFTIHPNDYLVDVALTVTLKGKDQANTKLAIRMVGAQDPDHIVKAGRVTRETRAACHLNGDVSQIPSKELQAKPNERSGEIRWVGFNHPYLFLAVAPKTNGANQNFACNAYADLAPDLKGGMEVDLVYPQRELAKDKPSTWNAVAFIGPKHLTTLQHADDVEGFEVGFDQSVNMGPWLGYLAKPMLWILLWFQGFVGNWGVAIILLTLTVKLATIYWTTKSMRSMKAMSALKPKIDELNKKHGDDKAKVQQEMMALYKQHGVNPLSGCLPMLLQMPIWLALYRMLSSAGELYQAPFIPGWVDDLTSTDPYYVLPVLMIGMMFLSSRLSPAQVDGFQQKLMVYGMPLIFGVMSFFFPSGLTLYIITNTTLSALHTLYMRKWDKSAKSIAAMQAAMKAPPAAAPPKAPPIDVVAQEKDGDDEDDDGGDDDTAAKQPQQRRTNAPRRKRKRRN